jgi:CheY-like chemotaxis protein
MYLAEDAHLVETAVDGRDAVQKLQKGRFDLLISDRSMPGLSGDELALAAHDVDPQLRILFLTGYGNAITEHGAHVTVNAIVSKPFTLESLRQGIAKAMS